MEALANPVGLGTAGLGARVLDVLQIEVQRVLVCLPVASVLAAAVGQNAQ